MPRSQPTGSTPPLRAQLIGGDDPVFSGTVVYRGVAPAEDVADLEPGLENQYWLGPYRHGVSYWLSARRLLAATVAVQDAAWSQESWTLEVPADEAVSHIDGWSPHLIERLRRCRTVLRGAVFVRPPIDRWVFDRVALLGDSAHAMAPFQAQGAAQAVEDAFVLAECVGDEPDDVPAALARYERVRMTRAEGLQTSSQTAANIFYLPDGEEQRARDAAYERLHETQPWGPRQRIWEHDVRDDLAAAARSAVDATGSPELPQRPGRAVSRLMLIAFAALYSSSVSAHISRPKPLRLTPPSGWPDGTANQVLTQTVPASSAAAMRWPRARSDVQTPAASP